MIVVFNGTVEVKRHGCPVCGGRSTHKTFQHTREYILPSGIRKKFRAGVPTEVSETDGNFLLSYKYTTREGEKPVFTKL